MLRGLCVHNVTASNVTIVRTNIFKMKIDRNQIENADRLCLTNIWSRFRKFKSVAYNPYDIYEHFMSTSMKSKNSVLLTSDAVWTLDVVRGLWIKNNSRTLLNIIFCAISIERCRQCGNRSDKISRLNLPFMGGPKSYRDFVLFFE